MHNEKLSILLITEKGLYFCWSLLRTSDKVHIVVVVYSTNWENADFFWEASGFL